MKMMKKKSERIYKYYYKVPNGHKNIFNSNFLILSEYKNVFIQIFFKMSLNLIKRF